MRGAPPPASLLVALVGDEGLRRHRRRLRPRDRRNAGSHRQPRSRSRGSRSRGHGHLPSTSGRPRVSRVRGRLLALRGRGAEPSATADAEPVVARAIRGPVLLACTRSVPSISFTASRRAASAFSVAAGTSAFPIVVKFHGNYLTFARAGIRRLVGGTSVVREAKGLVWSTGQTLTRGNWYAFRVCEAMVPSRAQRQDTIRSHLLRSSRVHVVPNGIDADAFAPGDREAARAEVGLPRGVVFLVLGRVYPGKGVDVAIRALAQADADASLVVVGDGESRGALEELARDVGAGARVRFVGAQPRERIPAYLRGADALVFPTLLPEAAPLDTSSGDGGRRPRDRVEARIDSRARRPARSQRDARRRRGRRPARPRHGQHWRAIQSLRARLGAAGRERVLAEYTLDRMIERTLDVYEVARARFARDR